MDSEALLHNDWQSRFIPQRWKNIRKKFNHSWKCWCWPVIPALVHEKQSDQISRAVWVTGDCLKSPTSVFSGFILAIPPNTKRRKVFLSFKRIKELKSKYKPGTKPLLYSSELQCLDLLGELERAMCGWVFFYDNGKFYFQRLFDQPSCWRTKENLDKM